MPRAVCSGRKIELVVEDDETNPEAAVRAAHKLVDVDKVPVIMGTWASAVTTAVAPVCWESKTFLTTVSGADSITHLPHQGYLIRTQPNNQLQATKHAEFIIRHGVEAGVHPGDPGTVRRADAEVSDRHADAEGRRRLSAHWSTTRTRRAIGPRWIRRWRPSRICCI